MHLKSQKEAFMTWSFQPCPFHLDLWEHISQIHIENSFSQLPNSKHSLAKVVDQETGKINLERGTKNFFVVRIPLDFQKGGKYISPWGRQNEMGNHEDRRKVKKKSFFLKLSAPPPSNYAVSPVIIIIICFILHLSIEFRTFLSKNQILECSSEKKKKKQF